MRMRQVAAQFPLENVDLRACKPIERLQIDVRRDARVGDDQDAMLHMIEREHGIEDHESGFVSECGIRLPVLLKCDRLEPRGRVVTEISDGSASKSWQLGDERRA